jgi:hypothetical protein
MALHHAGGTDESWLGRDRHEVELTLWLSGVPVLVAPARQIYVFS